MAFNSFTFFFFFIFVTTGYFLLPYKARILWLLAASCFFYMAFIPVYIFILLATIIVDYFAGIIIEKTESGGKKRLFLIVSLVSNIGFLAFFKYAGFVSDSLQSLAHFLRWNYSIGALEIILPLGLSFHTFQAMAYTIEVYRGNQKAERNFFTYSLYVMFYPQLVAGPIERPQNLLPQFYEKHDPDHNQIAQGLQRMLWGFFKKLVIADRMAVLVNQVFNHPSDYNGIPVWIAVYFFAFQIYCDFSGYSEIAIGAAQVMGFRLMRNFNQPYLSQSVGEFWKRWHISLSTWFQDYLYIPLGGNRVGKLRKCLNLMIVFVVSGLWHGACWTFVAWGALHGVFLISSQYFKNKTDFLWKFLGMDRWAGFKKFVRIFLTFQLVSLAWIFFRARSLSEAVDIFKRLFKDLRYQLFHPSQFLWNGKVLGNFYMGLDFYDVLVGLFGISALFIFYRIQSGQGIRSFLSQRSPWKRWTLYYLLIGVIVFFGFDRSNQFIYFQF